MPCTSSLNFSITVTSVFLPQQKVFSLYQIFEILLAEWNDEVAQPGSFQALQLVGK